MRFAALCAVLLVLAAAAAHAEESILQVFVSVEPDPRLEEVFYLAAGVELTRAGLTSRRTEVSVTDSSGAIDPGLVAREARRTDANFVLLMVYETRPSEVHIELLLDHSVFDGPLAKRSMTSPLDLDLDSRVAAAVRALITEAGVERRRTERTAIEGFDLSPRAPPIDPPAMEPRVTDPGLPEVSGPELAVTTAGILVVGDGTTFFRYGVAASLSGGYVPAGRAAGVFVGARGSVIRFLANAKVGGGTLSVVTAGPDVHVGSVYRSPARLAMRISGGYAAVIVAREEETLAKSVPFAEVGVFARLPIGRVVAVGMEINYLTVFEPGLPLMGLSPSVILSMEL